ncbi:MULTISPECIES: transposase [unclassified Microcoleus]|uniref:transposase n=1 Tax=unclassified Microcoleus TaxID=2642155 RepID=UPI002FD10CF7
MESAVLVAIDHTAWGRPDAKTLKDRTHEYQRGVTVGQGYSTIAWIPEAQGSWALPLLHERISSGSSPILQAASQLKLVCEQSVNPVLAVLDREYGNASWVLPLTQASILADCLMRVRKNACLWSAPPAYSGRGRPRKHGQKMRLNDPNTWLQADTAIEIDEHPELGKVLIRQWLDLHFYRAAQQKINLILALKNEAHVKRSAVSTLMVGLGWRTNSTQAKLFGLNICDVLESIIGIDLRSNDCIGHCLT